MRNRSFFIIFCTCFLFLVNFTVAEVSAEPSATYTVTYGGDWPGSGCTVASCSLRDAVMAANSTSATDTIIIPASMTVELASGQLLITQPVIIIGDSSVPGSFPVIDGQGGNPTPSSRIFEIAAGIEVEMGYVTIKNGKADKGGLILNHGTLIFGRFGGASLRYGQAETGGNFGDGGCIYNTSTGTIEAIGFGVTISNCSANFGGGIYNNGGHVILRKSLVWNNTASGHAQSNGGGIRNWSGGTVELYETTVRDNTATAWGGGIRNVGTGSELSLNDSWIHNNSVTVGGDGSSRGGGVWNSGYVESIGSLFDDNETSLWGSGSGIYNDISGVVVTLNSTFYGNIGSMAITNEGGLQLMSTTVYGNLNGGVETSGTAYFNNTAVLIGAATTFNDCIFSGTVTHDFSYDSDGSCGTFLTEANPQFTILADHGGSTETVALLLTSPLVNAGPAGKTCPLTDQRGYYRTDGHCDIGAYESDASQSPPTAVRVGEMGVGFYRFGRNIWLLFALLAGITFGKVGLAKFKP